MRDDLLIESDEQLYEGNTLYANNITFNSNDISFQSLKDKHIEYKMDGAIQTFEFLKSRQQTIAQQNIEVNSKIITDTGSVKVAKSISRNAETINIHPLSLVAVYEKKTEKKTTFSKSTQSMKAINHAFVCTEDYAQNTNTLMAQTINTVGFKVRANDIEINATTTTMKPAAALNTCTMKFQHNSPFSSTSSNQYSEQLQVDKGALEVNNSITFKGCDALVQGTDIRCKLLVNEATNLEIGPTIIPIQQFASQTMTYLNTWKNTKITQGGTELVNSTLDAETIKTQNAIKLINIELTEGTNIQGPISYSTVYPTTWYSETNSSSYIEPEQAMTFAAIVINIGITFLLPGSSVIVSSLLRQVLTKFAMTGDIQNAIQSAKAETVVKDLISDYIIKSLNFTPSIPLPKYIQDSIITNSITTCINIIDGDMNCEDAIKKGIISCAVDIAAKKACMEIGDLRKKKQIDYVSHKFIHGIVGGLSTQILHKDFASGFVGASVVEVLAEHVYATASSDIQNIIEECYQQGISPQGRIDEYCKDIETKLVLTQIGTLATSLLLGCKVSASYQSALTALNNNAIPCIIFGLVTLISAINTASEFNRIYEEEGVDSAINYLILHGVVSVVAKGVDKGMFAIGSIIFRSTPKMLKYVKNKLPFYNMFSKYKIIKVEGLIWGKSVKTQGYPWENALEKSLGPDYIRTVPNFKTFDFVSKRGIAVSAKTMNTMSESKIRTPKQIKHTIKKYVNDVINYKDHTLSNQTLLVKDIKGRRIDLAIPKNTGTEQMKQIELAKVYAKDNGVDLRIYLVR
jgi:hypothetical protein